MEMAREKNEKGEKNKQRKRSPEYGFETQLSKRAKTEN